MAITHKFLNHNFLNGFETRNSILHTTLYKPEVIFIGTFNHGWAWNNSDFFYGRDMYMWTILGNMFLHNQNLLVKRRTANNNVPTLPQLFQICEKGKIVFADIVKGVKSNIPTQELNNRNCVLVNNQYEWCSREIGNQRLGEYSDKHLDNLGNNGWLDDNVDEIINYINETESIKYVYFTFKTGGWVVRKLNSICRGIRPTIEYGSIFTPTGSGFGDNLGAPFDKKAWSISHCWVWNGLPNKVFVNKPGYCHLNHDWLISKGVNPNNF